MWWSCCRRVGLLGEPAKGPEPGSLVTVLDGRGKAMGSALFSAASQITLRMVSDVAGLTREAYLEDVAERVGAALRPAGACGSDE